MQSCGSASPFPAANSLAPGREAARRGDTLGFKKIGTTRLRVSFRSFMVQRDRCDTYWGAKKIIFLIRDIDDAAMAAVPAESCRFVVLRSPRGRPGSRVSMCNRLRRMRGRFQRWIHLPRCISSQMSPAQNAKVLDPELSGELQVRAHAA